MEGWLSVQEALQLLHENRMELSEQMLRRWLRQGKVQGIRPANRRVGWKISVAEVWHLIETRRWEGTSLEYGIDEQTTIQRLEQENAELRHQVDQLQEENSQLRVKLGEMLF